MDEHPCTLPLEYSYKTLGPGPHFVDVKFTDDCGQVDMKHVSFSLYFLSLDPGIITKYLYLFQSKNLRAYLSVIREVRIACLKIVLHITEPLLCYMNSGCVLECSDTPTSHSVTW